MSNFERWDDAGEFDGKSGLFDNNKGSKKTRDPVSTDARNHNVYSWLGIYLKFTKYCLHQYVI